LFCKDASLFRLDFPHETSIFPESAFFTRIGVFLDVLDEFFIFVLVFDVDSFEEELGPFVFVFFEPETAVSGSELFDLLVCPFFFVLVLKCNLEKGGDFVKELIFLFFLFGVEVGGFEVLGSGLFFEGMLGNGLGQLLKDFPVL
jgi:hypothetical protein